MLLMLNLWKRHDLEHFFPCIFEYNWQTGEHVKYWILVWVVPQIPIKQTTKIKDEISICEDKFFDNSLCFSL